MINDVINDTKDRMQASLDAFENDLRGMRSGRASTALVDRLLVDYYGQDTELRQLANISTPEAMQIMIRPFDPGAVSAIETAIQKANLGMNPNVDSGIIRLNMPPLTRESRQKLVKFLNQRTEEAKIAVRNIRRDANKDLKEFQDEGMISEDEMHKGQDQVQKLTDDFTEKIEAATKAKEAEIMEV